MGLQFLGWMENLEEDEMPPRAIWFADKELTEHFKAVRKRRKDKYSSDGSGEKEIDDPVQNDAARSLISG